MPSGNVIWKPIYSQDCVAAPCDDDISGNRRRHASPAWTRTMAEYKHNAKMKKVINTNCIQYLNYEIYGYLKNVKNY